MLLDMAAGGRLEDYDSVVVLLVDAFTRPSGARRTDADPRSLVGRIADPNGVTEAVDALLQANRRRLLTEFTRASDLLNPARDCDPEERHLPSALCERLDNTALREARRLLSDRLVFYHFGFHEVKDTPDEPDLRRKLDRIPTSFGIEEEHKQQLRTAVTRVINHDNTCLQAIARLVRQETTTPSDVRSTQQVCHGSRYNGRPLPLPPVARNLPPAQ